MKIDKKTLEAVSALPDAKMWTFLRIAASAAGVSLPEKTPDAEAMKNLRAALSDVGEDDIKRAAQLAAIYKGEQK